MYRRLFIAIAASALALTTTPAQAEFPRSWHVEGISSFLRGEATSTAINADGSVGLSPDIVAIARSQYGDFLDAALTPDGQEMYLGTGQPGHVVKLDKKGHLTSLFERQRSLVSAVAVAPKGLVYAATSPDGQLFRMDKKGVFQPFLDLEERYFWDLLPGKDGSLYVATGDKGAVYRVDAGGRSELYFQSSETNLRTLYQDDKAGLLVGGGSKGIIYRLTGKNKAEALFDSELPEITAIVGDKTGNLFISATNSQKDQGKPQGIVYWLSGNGKVDQLFRSENDMIFSLALDKQGDLLIGTGPQGRIFKIEKPAAPERRNISLIGRSQSRQAVALLPRFNEMVIVGSQAPQIELLKPGFRTTGLYASEILKSDLLTQWGNLGFQGTLPPGTQIEVRSRSGNTEEPDQTWSAWSPYADRATGSNIQSPPGRFLQLEFKLASNNAKASPRLYNFDVTYLRRNVPPRIREVYRLQRGIYFRPQPLNPIPTSRSVAISPEILNKMRQPRDIDSLYAMMFEEERESAVRMIQDEKPGMLTLAWDAADDNGDDLLYDIYYRLQGQGQWIALKQNWRPILYSFDSLALLDGQYHFRVYATDSLSNPGERAYRVFQDTDLITIDNSPPVISNLGFRNHTLSFTVADQVSNLAIVHVSLDGEHPPRIAQSRDGIVDGIKEDFAMALKDLPKGPHLIMVKCIDRAGNMAVAHHHFQIR